MPEDDYEARIEVAEALIRHQEAANKKQDRPQPNLKPKPATRATQRYQPKSNEQIRNQAVQAVEREDQEKLAKQAENKQLSVFDEKRKTVREKFAERAERIENNPKAKKNRTEMQQRDQQSRFFDKDRDR